MSRTVASLFPADPPRFYERTPHGYVDPVAIRAELERAGFQRIELQTITGTVSAALAQRLGPRDLEHRMSAFVITATP